MSYPDGYDPITVARNQGVSWDDIARLYTFNFEKGVGEKVNGRKLRRTKFELPVGVERYSSEYYHLYRLANLEHAREYARAYNHERYTTHYETEIARRKRWDANNPEKIAAHRAIMQAKAKGQIIPKPCFCGEERVQAHHPDHSKPLDVIWVCSHHHQTVYHHKSEQLPQSKSAAVPWL